MGLEPAGRATMTIDRRCILCIDDNEDTCMLLATWLAFSNCEVTSAFTMERGIAMAQTRCFDLYLVDSRLPDGSGLEVCRKIRAFDSFTPILFWSGDDDAGAEAYAAGAQIFLAKPIDPDPFKKTLEELLVGVEAKRDERSLTCGHELPHRKG
jgi:DNA-binding response OmpR family regulator